jgi:23S rRNA pseudouridine2457 synthase
MHTFAVYKPFGVLSQFTSEDGHPGLLDLGLNVPKDVWPVGRLDRDSEGLLLLTNDKHLKRTLTEPEHSHRKTYWVQVEGAPTDGDIEPLRHPMHLRIRKKDTTTKPAGASLLAPPDVPERVPPIRKRLSIPTTWLSIVLKEGKNRQIRKMTAHIGFPTLRIIRVGIGSLAMNELQLVPGECRPLTAEEVLRLQQ